jgi:hypothetical protein
MDTSAEKLVWHRSSLCGTSTCVEVASGPSAVHLRDSKNPDGPWLEFSHPVWRDLIHCIKDGGYGTPR